MALGARRQDVQAMVVRRGLVLALAGIGIGLLCSLALSHSMTSLLYEVAPTDLVTFAAVALFLAAVALLATWLPARRASRVDPVIALRYE
jgi:ABC-type antimicrobial peptide transport system permease subunit